MGKAVSTEVVRESSEILSLPEWLISKALEVARQSPSQSLTEAQRLTLEQRKWVQDHLVILEASLAFQTGSEKEIIAEVGQFLLVYTNVSLSEDEQAARARAYAVALDDTPLWALKAAIRRWHRGELNPKLGITYAWPQPAMLRHAVAEVLTIANGKKLILENLLVANDAPLPEVFSDEHRKTMLGKIAGLFSNAGKTKAAFQE